MRELIQLRQLPCWQQVGKTVLWSSLMAAGMGSAIAQTGSTDVVVNHDAIPETATGPAGGNFTYAPLVSLNAGSAATDLKLTQVLPAGVRLNSISFEPSGRGQCASPAMPVDITADNRTIECDLNDITEAGSENGIRVLFHVTIPEVGTNWRAVASATFANTNDKPGSNQNLERNITTTAAADLGIELSAPSSGVKQFSPFNYTIKVTNHGPSPIPDNGSVEVIFTVPAQSTASAASGSG